MANLQTSTVVPVEEAVDNLWDVCEETFGEEGDFHRWFIADKEQYFHFLKRSFARIFAAPNGQAVGGIGKCLFDSGIDRIALHYRSRRVKENDFISWQKFVFDLTKIEEGEEWYTKNKEKLEEPWTDPPHLDTRDYYGGKTLRQHIFRKVKRNRILCFEFLEKNKTDNYVSNDGDINLLRIPFLIYKSIAEELKSSQDYIIGKAVRENLAKKLKAKDNNKFLKQLDEYCKNNLLDENQPKDDEERIQFLIDSSLITLILLAEDKLPLPRSFILVPIFVSNESFGGMAFFSKDGAKLRSNGRTLKYLAINLLVYVSAIESRQIEAEKRLLEASSPIVHLFVHSVNKAFTTPIQNICDEIGQAANLLAMISRDQPAQSFAEKSTEHTQPDALRRSSERLRVIEKFLSSFSKRWSGTLAALASQHIESEVDTPIRFLAIDHFDGKNVKQELSLQVQALFSVQLANDIFDCSEFSGYRPLLESFDGLDKLVELRFNVQDKIVGNKDVMLLFLLELVQNAIEALPLGQILWDYKDCPRRLTQGSSGFRIEITSREEREWIVVEVSNNGRRFAPEILEQFQKYLPEFARPDFPPPTLGEIRQRVQDASETKSGGGVSNKSGSALGLGIFGIADYVSRICLVEWDRKEPSEPDYPDQEARIIRRGKIEIESPPKEEDKGSIVRIILPKEPFKSDSDKLQRVFFGEEIVNVGKSRKKRILILEDAREDRSRFRCLFEKKGLDLEPDRFEFAWAWPDSDQGDCSVLEWFRQQMGIADNDLDLNQILEKSQKINFSNYSLILLDLAWTANAERVMGKMQLLPSGTGYEMAKHESLIAQSSETTNTSAATLDAPNKQENLIAQSSETERSQRLEENQERFQRLKDNVEGVQFLEWWKDLKAESKPKIWVTSAYLPSTAWEIRQFIDVRYHLPMFHKWNDEDSLLLEFRNILKEFSSLCDKEDD